MTDETNQEVIPTLEAAPNEALFASIHSIKQLAENLVVVDYKTMHAITKDDTEETKRILISLQEALALAFPRLKKVRRQVFLLQPDTQE